MIQQLSTKTVRTRKSHRCFACLRRFPANTYMQASGNIADGRVYTLYTCDVCNVLMTEFKKYFLDESENCFPQGCVTEGYENGVETPEDLLIKLRTNV